MKIALTIIVAVMVVYVIITQIICAVDELKGEKAAEEFRKYRESRKDPESEYSKYDGYQGLCSIIYHELDDTDYSPEEDHSSEYDLLRSYFFGRWHLRETTYVKYLTEDNELFYIPVDDVEL